MSLTPRENLLKLWRREGFEYAPAHFWLCPSLAEEFNKRYANAESYEDMFNFPFRGVSAAMKENKQDWMRYYPGVTFNPDTRIDDSGVAHEPHPGSMHMTRMHHPMKNLTSLDEFKAYPYPELHHDSVKTLTSEIAAIHDRGLAVMGGPGSIWENSWYPESRIKRTLFVGSPFPVPNLLSRSRILLLVSTFLIFPVLLSPIMPFLKRVFQIICLALACLLHFNMHVLLTYAHVKSRGLQARF